MAKREHFLILEQAYQRLNKILEIYRQHGVVTEQQHQTLANDYQSVKALPKSATHNPYLLEYDQPGAYFRLYDDYLRYKATVPDIAQMIVNDQHLQRCVDEQGNVSFSDGSCLSEAVVQQKSQQPIENHTHSKLCRELAVQASKAKLRYQQAVSALIAMDPDVIDSTPDWRAVEITRNEALSDYKFHLTRAGWIGCPLAQEDLAQPLQTDSVKRHSNYAGEDPFIDLSYAAGRLLFVGNNPVKRTGGTVTLLRDGSILQYGAGRHEHGHMLRSEYLQALRKERRSLARLSNHAWLRDSKRQDWLKVDNPKECPEGGRLHHTATLLNDGKLLFAGGLCDAQLQAETNQYAEYSRLSLWDPETGNWLTTPSLHQSRLYHTASLLKDGSVLFVGGEADPGVVFTSNEPVINLVERYREGQVEKMPSLSLARAKHTATVMENGCVLVTGGFDSNTLGMGLGYHGGLLGISR
jgi:hypothetical protein